MQESRWMGRLQRAYTIRVDVAFRYCQVVPIQILLRLVDVVMYYQVVTRCGQAFRRSRPTLCTAYRNGVHGQVLLQWTVRCVSMMIIKH